MEDADEYLLYEKRVAAQEAFRKAFLEKHVKRTPERDADTIRRLNNGEAYRSIAESYYITEGAIASLAIKFRKAGLVHERRCSCCGQLLPRHVAGKSGSP